MQTSSKEQAAGAWAAAYMPPQFGRKRAPDLSATGPSGRGAAGGLGGTGARGGGGLFVAAADDATSYATSYNTSYQRR
jgi:hypothetical protein